MDSLVRRRNMSLQEFEETWDYEVSYEDTETGYYESGQNAVFFLGGIAPQYGIIEIDIWMSRVYAAYPQVQFFSDSTGSGFSTRKKQGWDANAQTDISGAWVDIPGSVKYSNNRHVLRMEVLPSGCVFYVDGVLKATGNGVTGSSSDLTGAVRIYNAQGTRVRIYSYRFRGV